MFKKQLFCYTSIYFNLKLSLILDLNLKKKTSTKSTLYHRLVKDWGARWGSGVYNEKNRLLHILHILSAFLIYPQIISFNTPHFWAFRIEVCTYYKFCRKVMPTSPTPPPPKSFFRKKTCSSITPMVFVKMQFSRQLPRPLALK